MICFSTSGRTLSTDMRAELTAASAVLMPASAVRTASTNISSMYPSIMGRISTFCLPCTVAGTST